MPPARLATACSVALLVTASGAGFVAGERGDGARATSSSRGQDATVRDGFASRRVTADEGCRTCHEDVALEWGASQHRGAWSEATFQRAFAVEPLAFCRDCHAPEGRSLPKHESVLSASMTHDPGSGLGVTCVTCHLENDGQTVRTGMAGTMSHGASAAPHPVRRDPAMSRVDACASCHEFDFPGGFLRSEALAMQATITEHASSAASERPCQDCHMPWVDGAQGRRRSHRFRGGHDGAFAARALDVTVERSEGETVTVTLATTSEVGHAVPTGDLFRRLAVELVAETADGPQTIATRVLTRTFDDKPGPQRLPVRQEVSDDRPRFGSAAELHLGIPARLADAPLALRVWLERVQHPRGDDPRDAVLASRTLLSSMTVAPAKTDASTATVTPQTSARTLVPPPPTVPSTPPR